MHARYMYFLPIGLDQQKKNEKNQLKIVNVFLSISLNIGFIVGTQKIILTHNICFR